MARNNAGYQSEGPRGVTRGETPKAVSGCLRGDPKPKKLKILFGSQQGTMPGADATMISLIVWGAGCNHSAARGRFPGATHHPPDRLPVSRLAGTVLNRSLCSRNRSIGSPDPAVDCPRSLNRRRCRDDSVQDYYVPIPVCRHGPATTSAQRLSPSLFITSHPANCRTAGQEEWCLCSVAGQELFHNAVQATSPRFQQPSPRLLARMPPK